MAKFRRSPAEGVAINQTRSYSKHASNSARAQAEISGSLRAACNVKHWHRLLAQWTFVRLPLHRLNGANGMSDMEGKVTRVGASERGQRTSLKIVCCNFCKGLFLKAGWRWVDRNYEKKAPGSAIEEELVNTLYAQS